ncbi:hypothetical protein HBB16_02780 [Pseudonocardia sp. MCCB 268]|nr:hypothetical protein [Pseudonocardia cytotoxica]
MRSSPRGIAGLAAHNEQQEPYLTDLVEAAVAGGRTVHAVRCADEWLLRGSTTVQLAELRAELNRRLVRRWMLDGVTVVDPPPPGSTSRSRDRRRPSTWARSCTAAARSATGPRIGPDTTLTDCVTRVRPSSARTVGVRDRGERSGRPVRLPAPGTRGWGPRARSARSSR